MLALTFWNTLPLTVPESSSYVSFQRRLKERLIEQQQCDREEVVLIMFTSILTLSFKCLLDGNVCMKRR